MVKVQVNNLIFKSLESRTVNDLILRDWAKTFAEWLIMNLEQLKTKLFTDPKTGKISSRS